jgi:hypothetical protein
MRANYLLSYTWPSLSRAHVGRGCPGNFQDGDDLSYAALRNRYTHRHVATDATCMQPRRYRSHAAGFPRFCAGISDRQKRPGRELAASFSRNWVSRITRERLPNGTGLTTGNRESVPSIRSSFVLSAPFGFLHPFADSEEISFGSRARERDRCKSILAANLVQVSICRLRMRRSIFQGRRNGNAEIIY